MVAAAKLRGEQNRLAAATKFGSWTSVLEGKKSTFEDLEDVSYFPDHSVVVALTSDKGLCGGVHSAGRSQLRRMVGDSLSMAAADIPPHNFNYASMVAETALELDADKAGAIQVVYNEFVSAIAHNPTIKSIELSPTRAPRHATNYDAEDTVLKGLYEYYVATEIFYGMMQGATRASRRLIEIISGAAALE
ncbi:proton-transporting ATP synthase [Aureococcus anophagefferens]|nr:proton-transporting ATP synthase [Aureococcus anophagefferens]